MMLSLVAMMAAALAQAAPCKEASLSQIVGGKTQTVRKLLCWEPQGERVVSPPCQKNCSLLEAAQAKPAKLEELLHPVGSPLFRACYRIGGSPRIYRWKRSGAQEEELMLCEREGEAVDLATIFRMVKQ